MKEFITALASNYQLDKYHIKNNVAVFHISSKIIVKSLHHTKKTQRYLSTEYFVENGHYNARILRKLAPYESEVIKLRSEGMIYPNIHKIITEKGYKGSIASLSMFIQKTY